MKVFNVILKVVAALVVAAGILYAVVTYGDKIVAWAKNLWTKMSCCCSKASQEETTDEEIIDTEESIEAAEESAVEATEESVQDEDFEG